MTNVDALKTLYVALGGSADDVADVSLISDMIAKIAIVAGAVKTAATTAELPTVTKTDSGKVLTVDSSGKWTAATPAS